jgi:hypothetical protein
LLALALLGAACPRACGRREGAPEAAVKPAPTPDAAPLAAAPIDARPPDAGPPPGIHGSILALAVGSKGELYAGGEFQGLGSVIRWDGTRWSLVGSPLWGGVQALAADGAGKLYTRGGFSEPAGCIARWNGSAWSALGEGLACCPASCTNEPGPLVIDGANNLYTTDRPTAVKKWDGTSWSELAGPPGASALAVTRAGTVFCLGQFNPLGDEGRDYFGVLARWTGQDWEELVQGAFGWDVQALAADDAGHVYLGGSFSKANDVRAPGLVAWNGEALSRVGRRRYPYEGAAVLAVDPGGSLYAGTGAGQVARWNGRSWAAFGAPFEGHVYLRALAVDRRGVVYVALEDNSTGMSHVGRWDGHAWSVLPFDWPGDASSPP